VQGVQGVQGVQEVQEVQEVQASHFGTPLHSTRPSHPAGALPTATI